MLPILTYHHRPLESVPVVKYTHKSSVPTPWFHPTGQPRALRLAVTQAILIAIPIPISDPIKRTTFYVSSFVRRKSSIAYMSKFICRSTIPKVKELEREGEGGLFEDTFNSDNI